MNCKTLFTNKPLITYLLLSVSLISCTKKSPHQPVDKQENLYVAVDDYNEIIYIDKNGNEVFRIDTTEAVASDFGNFKNGVLIAAFRKDKKYMAILDNGGDQIFKSNDLFLVESARMEPFNNHIAIVGKFDKNGQADFDGAMGLIDANGHFSIPLSKENKRLSYVGNKMFIRDYNFRFELIDEKGTLIQTFQRNNFNGNTFSFTIGQNLIGFKYKTPDFANDVLDTVTPNDKWGYMDLQKNVVIMPEYDNVYPFSEGFATVVVGDEYKIINKAGKNILESRFDGYRIHLGNDKPKFVNGLANVCIGHRTDFQKPIRCGYIDTLGNWKIAPEYIEATQFSYGLAQVMTDSMKTRIIDTNGHTIVEGFWGRGSNIADRWDNHMIYIPAISSYFDHKGKLIWKAQKPHYSINTPMQLHYMKEEDLKHVEYIGGLFNDIRFKNYLTDFRFLKRLPLCVNTNYLMLGSPNLNPDNFSLTDVYKLTKLEKLILKEINFEKMPEGISALKDLQVLDLSFSKIKELPADIYQLKNLREVNIDYTPLASNKKAVAELRTHLANLNNR